MRDFSTRFRNFVRGVGSTVDLWPVPRSYQVNLGFMEADVDALRGDWERVGSDLAAALCRYESEAAHVGEAAQAGAEATTTAGDR